MLKQNMTKYQGNNMNEIVAAKGGKIGGMKRDDTEVSYGERMMGECHTNFGGETTWSQFFDLLITEGYCHIYKIYVN
jgi:hypothetical protein